MINLSDYKRIHCIGIGGIGLSAIAEILMSRGYEVSGSDMRESEMTDKLINDGANIYLGHRAKNVEMRNLLFIVCCRKRQSGAYKSRGTWNPGSYESSGAGSPDG